MPEGGGGGGGGGAVAPDVSVTLLTAAGWETLSSVVNSGKSGITKGMDGAIDCPTSPLMQNIFLLNNKYSNIKISSYLVSVGFLF